MIDALIETALWALIDAETGAWRRRGHMPQVWWRDDDARGPSESLDRLFALAKARQAPLALAVIPDLDLTALAAVLPAHSSISIIQHGCDHVDRSPSPQVSSEFAPDTSPDDVARKILSGWERLSVIPGTVPVFVPPWNVLLPNVREALRQTPFRAVSTYGAAAPRSDGLADINTHIDIMRWRPARFRGGAEILTRLWRQLRARRRRQRWNEPIGLLTHHKNLDTEAWSFLDRLLGRLADRTAGFRWRSLGELLEEANGRE
jgi:hypothetical protein